MDKEKIDKAKKEINWDAIKKFLLEKRISSAQLIMIVGTLLWLVFLGDTLEKIIFYSIVQVIITILGVSFLNMKKMAEKITDIYYNPKLTSDQKEREYMKIALVILDKIGELFDSQADQGIMDLRTEEQKAKVKVIPPKPPEEVVL